jgi:hypothetical protein
MLASYVKSTGLLRNREPGRMRETLATIVYLISGRDNNPIHRNKGNPETDIYFFVFWL